MFKYEKPVELSAAEDALDDTLRFVSRYAWVI